MKHREASAIRDQRIDRSRRIAQSLFVVTAATGGVGVGLMSHAAAAPSTTSTPLNTTTTVWTPPVTVPVTHPTTCHTSASGQFLGCW
jgi:hypothetical protein